MKPAALILSALGLITLTGCGTQVQNMIKAQGDLTEAQRDAQIGNGAGAKSLADQAIAVDPNALGTYLPVADTQPGELTVAAVFTESGDEAALRDYMKQAAAKHPDDYRPLQLLTRAYATLGDTANQRATAAEEAALLEKKIVAPGATHDSQLTLALAQAYCDANYLAKGATDYQAVIRTSPADPTAYNNLAYAYAVADSKPDLASARGLAQQALALATKQNRPEEEIAGDQDTLGWVQYRQGDFKNALTNLQAAVNVLPRLAESRYHLGMVYEALGQTDAARAELGHAVLLTKGYADAKSELNRLNKTSPAQTAADSRITPTGSL